MLFDSIFLSIFVAGWLIVGGVPWLVLSIATRGHAGLQHLPLAMFTGVVAGLAVPILGRTDATGLWLSFVAALTAPAALLAVRRFSLRGLPVAPGEASPPGRRPG